MLGLTRSKSEAGKEAATLLTKFVLNVNSPNEQELRSFRHKWASLDLVEKKTIIDEITFEHLAMCEWKFIGEALDHSNKILAFAAAGLLLTALGAYKSTGELIGSLITGACSGAIVGMLTFSYYNSVAKNEDTLRRQRLDTYSSCRI